MRDLFENKSLHEITSSEVVLNDALTDTKAVEANIIREYVDPQAYEGMTDAELLDTLQSWEADSICCQMAEGCY